ncbi:MAG: hypothetical protein ABIU77_16510, partial [Ferruginibacter sp.]
MKLKLFLLPLLLLAAISSFSQGIGIGTTTPDASAALDIVTANKGLLIPRMSTTTLLAIPTPATALLVYDLTTKQLKVNTGTPAAPNWQPVASTNSNGWNVTGNNAIDAANQFIGTTDLEPLHFRVNNVQVGELHPVSGNIFWGLRSGEGNTTAKNNIGIGTSALIGNTTSDNLVGIGNFSLSNNSTGVFNTAVGSRSMFANTTGSNNAAF